MTEYERLDTRVRRAGSCSLRAARALIAGGRVRVDGVVCRAKGQTVAAAARVTIEPLAQTAWPAEVPRPAVLQTEGDYLVLDKPAGLPVLPHRDRPGPSVAGWLLEQFPGQAEAGGDGDAGICHRLDNETSGVLLVARNAAAYAGARRAFQQHRVTKFYFAIAASTGGAAHQGQWREIDAALAHHSSDPARMVVAGATAKYRGKPQAARTAFRVVAAYGPALLLAAVTQFGRRHQVRLHAAHAGMPLAGDELYGGAPWSTLNLADAPAIFQLHAAALSLPRVDADPLFFAAPPPLAFESARAALGLGNSPLTVVADSLPPL